MAKFCRAELNGGLNQHFFFGNAGNECSFKSLGLFALTGPGFIAGGVLVLRGTLCASGLGRRNFTATDFCGSESKLFDELDGHFFCIASEGLCGFGLFKLPLLQNRPSGVDQFPCRLVGQVSCPLTAIGRR